MAGWPPCLSAAEYIRYGVKIDDDHQPCFALSQTIRQAEQQLDIANHQLIIHIPQQYIEHYPRDYVSPCALMKVLTLLSSTTAILPMPIMATGAATSINIFR
ncbi:FimD/PapC N-terminal domain-containing protein [Klebsiella pneumoniae subsp. pneumoniae]|nr:FimD/PapC N-terminal domain-containing protein [Klebsiella pneumoniae subsp. pneumoniae]